MCSYYTVFQSMSIVSPSAWLLCILQGTGLKMVSTLLAHCPSSVNCVGSRKLRPLHFAAYMVCTQTPNLRTLCSVH